MLRVNKGHLMPKIKKIHNVIIDVWLKMYNAEMNTKQI